MRVSLLALATALGVAASVSAPASAQTVITADGSTATIVSAAGATTTISGGTLAGTNLFHSFGQFDLSTGDIAQWVRTAPDAASISNVINRVTGGSPSDIDGTLRVTGMPNADFWFVNPAGVFFGPNSAVDVPGAFNVSTAQRLDFADGTAFRTGTPNGSTFSAAAPEAFGFLGGQGDIGVDNASWFVGGPVSISAANVEFSGLVIGDAVSLVAVGEDYAGPLTGDLFPEGGSLVVGFDQPGVTYTASINATSGGITLKGGTVSLVQTLVDASTQDARASGDVTILGNTVDIFDSFVTTQSNGSGDAGALFVGGDDVFVAGSTLFNQAVGDGSVGDLALVAGSLTLLDTLVESASAGEGDAGDVSINAFSLLADNSTVASAAFGSGATGSVEIFTDATIDLVDTFVTTQTFNDAPAGDISIGTGDLTLTRSFIAADTFGGGAAGDVFVDGAFTATLFDSEIRSSARAGSTGDAGFVYFSGGDVVLAGTSFVFSNTFADTSGNAGLIIGSFENLSILDNSEFNTNTLGSGDAGNLTITATGTLLIDGPAAFLASQANVGATGNGGDINLAGGTLIVEQGQINALTFGPGVGGNISINFDTIRIGALGVITSAATDQSTGDFAGDIDITFRSLTIDGGVIESTTDSFGDSGDINLFGLADSELIINDGRITTTSRDSGTAGDISIFVTDTTITGPNASISSDTTFDFEGGAAGTVSIAGESLTIADGAEISSNSLGSGNAGSIFITVPDVLLDGGFIRTDVVEEQGGAGVTGLIFIDGTLGGTETGSTLTLVNGAGITSRGGPVPDDAGATSGFVILRADAIRLSDSTITVDTSGPADAGNIDIGAVSLLLEQGSEISTSTFAQGGAGFVNIAVEDLTIRGGSGITLESVSDDPDVFTGSGGSIFVEAENILLDNGFISAEVDSPNPDSGFGGSFDLVAGRIELRNGSLISSSANTNIGPGFITISTDALVLSGGSAILDESLGGLGVASLEGSIAIRPRSGLDETTGSVSLSGGSRISTTSTNGGDAGPISIFTGALSVAGGSAIISEARSSDPAVVTGSGGLIAVNAETIKLDDGAISSEVVAVNPDSGFGGLIRLTAGSIDLRNASLVSSSANTFAGPGFISINTDALSLSGASSIRDESLGGNAVESLPGGIDLRPRNGLDQKTGTISLSGNSVISTITTNSGEAGPITIYTGTLDLERSQITSSAIGQGDAGSIFIDGVTLLMDAAGITSSSATDANAGELFFNFKDIRLDNGSAISTNSQRGNAGQITITMPTDGTLILSGETPSQITTNVFDSDAQGGKVVIASPFLIVSNGGLIQAINPAGNSEGEIDARFFFSSADRINRVTVTGALFLSSQIDDPSAGLETPSIDFLDASSVLSGACAGARSSGRTSQFTSRITGPYALPRVVEPAPDPRTDPAPAEPPPLSLVALGRTCG